MKSFRLSLLPRVAVLAATGLAVTLLPATSASAIQITVNGNNYEIANTNTTFNAITENVLDDQIWWNNSTLARDFARAYRAASPPPRSIPGSDFTAFAYLNPDPNFPNLFRFWDPYGLFDAFETGEDRTFNVNFFTATLVTTPPPTTSSVPGPLPLLGAAAAFGYSRKLRQRIRLIPPQAAID